MAVDETKKQLDSLRKIMDRLDKEIKALLLKRLQVSDGVADVKIENEDKVFKPDREKEMTDRLSEDVKEEYIEEYRQILGVILSTSRKYQYRKIQTHTRRFEKMVTVKRDEDIGIDIHCLPALPLEEFHGLVKGQFYVAQRFDFQQLKGLFSYLAYHQLFLTCWQQEGKHICVVDTCLFRRENQTKVVLGLSCASLNDLSRALYCISSYGIPIESMVEHGGAYYVCVEESLDQLGMKTLALQLAEEFPLSGIVAVF